MQRILLAEDDQNLAAVLLEALAEEGFAVTHASTTAEVARLARAACWDLCILDTLDSQVQREPRTAFQALLQLLPAEVPVLVTSGQLWAHSSSASDLGVAAILTKPFDLDDFYGAVRAALSA